MEERGPLFKKIAVLSNQSANIEEECANLQAHINSLKSCYEKREQEYVTAAAELRDQYDAIIQEATEKASSIIVAATRQATEALEAVIPEKEAWAAEKKRLACTQHFEPRIKLDVGGARFTTSLTTLCRFPDSMIGAMFSGRHALPTDGEGYHFIDRDGTHFRHILNFLRSPETFRIELPNLSLHEFKNEVEYYGLTGDMFPFVPAAPMDIFVGGGVVYRITQNEDGIWLADGTELEVCRQCFSAQKSSIAASSAIPGPGPSASAFNAPAGGFVFGKPVIGDKYIKNFINGPDKRELVDNQPQPSFCLACSRLILKQP